MGFAALAALGVYQISELSSVRALLAGNVSEMSETMTRLQASTSEAGAGLLERLQALQARLRAEESSETLVFFEFGSEAISPGGLDAIAEFARREGGHDGPIGIDGFADTTGSEAYNAQLSLLRAQAVQAELVRRGIQPDRIEREGPAAH